ncbi:MAG: integrase family protein [Candidatus Obscuribacter sp.]|nr:integrase family protein [Candidatus Obscuribacter sp.]
MRIIKSEVDKTNAPGFYLDDTLKGFGLNVTVGRKDGRIRKVYLVKAKMRGRTADGKRQSVTYTIGPHGVFTPDQARDAAREALMKILKGINPNDEIRAERQTREAERQKAESEKASQSMTLAVALDKFLGTHSGTLSDNTLRVYGYVVRKHLKDWLPLPLRDITREMCESRYLEIRRGASGKSHESVALLTFSALGSIYTYILDVYGHRYVDGNPSTVVKRYKQAVPPRDDYLDDFRLRQWWKAVEALKNQEYQDYMKLLLLTGLRVQELARMEWSEVDFTARSWTVRKTKNKRDQTLPFTNEVERILVRRFSELSEGEAFVFPVRNGRGDIHGHRSKLDGLRKSLGFHFMPHSLRKTIASHAALMLPGYLVKRILNHHSRNDISQHHYVHFRDLEAIRPQLQKLEDAILLKCRGKDESKVRKSRKAVS